jgi:hypothetical protein
MRNRLILLIFTGLIVWGCGEDKDPLSPAEILAIARISGNAQEGRTGVALSAPLVVLVTNNLGVPVANQRVDFVITQGEGRLSVESAVSDSRGQASTRLVLGDQVGEVHVQARIFGHVSVVEFLATVLSALPGGDIPLTGLVAYYPFDGDANDASGNANHGIVNGATLALDRWGIVNSAYHFDGEDDWVKIENSPSLNIHGSTGISICVWIKAEIFSSTQGIVSKWGRRGAEDNQFTMQAKNDALLFQLSDEPTAIRSQTRLQRDIWYFIIGMYDFENQEIRISINGILDNAKSLEFSIWDTDQYLEIGREAEINTFFQGLIDDIRIYDRALSDEEIQALYLDGGWDPTFDPDEGDIPDVPLGPTNVLRLDGTDDWVKIPVLNRSNPLSYPGSGGWSLEGWVKPTNRRSVAVIAGQASTDRTGFDPYYLEIGDGSSSCCGGGSIKISDTNSEGAHSGMIATGVTVDTWTHFAGTYENEGPNKTLRFYINGNLTSEDETSLVIDSRASPNDPFAIGALASWSGSSGFVPVAGEIDEVRVWNRTLSREEIQTNMNQELTGQEEGLIGYWNFNGLNEEGLVPDLTGNGNNGILMFDAHLAESQDTPVP